MTLTLFSDYSLRILMFAALRKDRRFSVDEVAGIYRLSRNHAAKVVHFLAQHGYLESRRGRGGGLSIGKEPAGIRVGELVRLTERGPLVECFDPATNSCPLSEACALKTALGRAWAAFFQCLDGYTLADLVHKPDALRLALGEKQ